MTHKCISGSMVVIFVPNTDECPVMQQFVPELYKNEAVLEEEADTTKKEKELNTNISKTETTWEREG